MTDMDSQDPETLKSNFDQHIPGLPLSIDKYSAIESMKHLVCKGDLNQLNEQQQDPTLRIERQYKSSQQVLMHILHSPVKQEPVELVVDKHAFDYEEDFMTFQNKTALVPLNISQILSEQESESKSSVKTPFSKGKSIKEKSSQKSKKKKRSKMKSDKKKSAKDDHSIKNKKQQFKMFISQ